MAKSDSARQAIIALLSQNYGERTGVIFADMYSGETFPIFLHNSFLLLKDFVGVKKAKEQLDQILTKSNSYIPYE